MRGAARQLCVGLRKTQFPGRESFLSLLLGQGQTEFHHDSHYHVSILTCNLSRMILCVNVYPA